MIVKLRLVGFSISILAVLSGCSFNSIESRSNTANRSNVAIVESANSSEPGSPVDTNVVNEGVDPTVAGSNTTGPLTAENDPNSPATTGSSANGEAFPVSDARRRKDLSLHGFGPDGKPLPAGQTGPPPPPRVTEAPDNSTFSVSLTDVAREVRTFRDNPTLIKVEREMSGKGQTARVYLKNGKVITLPGDKLEGLANLSALEILIRAGLSSPADRTSKK